MLSHTLTILATGANALIFRVEYCLLQHSQQNHSADPELDPQQVSPVAGTPEQPKHPKEHVHIAHDHEELWEKTVTELITAQPKSLYLWPDCFFLFEGRLALEDWHG